MGASHGYVVEVAHDYQTAVKKYIVDDFGIKKSFDTCHGNVSHLHTLTMSFVFAGRYQ